MHFGGKFSKIQCKFHWTYIFLSSTCKIEQLLTYHGNEGILKKNCEGNYYKKGIVELEEEMKKNPGSSKKVRHGVKEKSQRDAHVRKLKAEPCTSTL